VVVVGLIGMLLSLSGCRAKAPLYEDTRHLENPPPTPPNCPDLPELTNVTLKDGSVADVRIIQFNDSAKLYVPASWFKGVDKEFRPGGFIPKIYLSNFAPDIHSFECPGIIHKFIPERPNSDRVRPMISVEIRRDLAAAKNVSLGSEITNIGITTDQERQSSELSIVSNGGSHDALVYLPDGLLAFLRTKTGYRRKNVKSASLVEYVEWLKTPPAKRDNARIFMLKVDS